jgi:hypothetical protein
MGLMTPPHKKLVFTNPKMKDAGLIIGIDPARIRI